MPLHKQPLSLRAITEKHIGLLLLNTCLKIEKKFGSYDNKTCREQVDSVQAHLINNIGHFMDNFCIGFTGPLSATLPHTLMDTRISNGIFLHSGTKSFYQGHVQPRYEDRAAFCAFVCAAELGQSGYINYPKVFFTNKFQLMTNVLELDISFIRNADELFKVIGIGCKKLQKLLFDSRTFIRSNRNSKNLMHLRNCSEIRIIVDVWEKFKKFAVSDLRRLIKCIPKLTCINHEHLGVILSSDMEDSDTPLSLTHALERNVKLTHVQAFTTHCPQLQSLILVNSECPYYQKQTLIALSKSSIRLTYLELSKFSFQNVINTILKNKGKPITSLKLHGYAFEKGAGKLGIIKLGMFCPNLTCLHICVHKNYAYRHEVADRETVINPDLKLFQNLQSLQFYDGLDYNDGIVSLCLKNALKIKDISLNDSETTDWTNTGGALVTLENPMTELETLQINCNNVKLTPRDVTSLYGKFPCLKSIDVFSGHMTDETAKQVEEIRNTIHENNFNIKFVVDGAGLFDHDMDEELLEFAIDEILLNLAMENEMHDMHELHQEQQKQKEEQEAKEEKQKQEEKEEERVKQWLDAELD